MSFLEKLIVCIGLSGLVGAGLVALEHHGYQRAVDDQAAQAKAADTKREATTKPVEAGVVADRVRIVTVTKTILKDRPVYVKDTDCPMPAGFRVLHDAAANGQVPDPSRIADAAPAPAEDVADTVAENYGICQGFRADLARWQEWARKQQDLKTE